ncbi:MAG: tyrosine--tRNA ligase, partial [Tagaea sp.]
NEAKKILAFEATKLAHGEEEARAAAETARRTFEEGQSAEGLPTVEIPAAEFAGGIGVLDLFVRAGLAASKGEARRLVQGKGAKIDDAVVASDTLLIPRPAAALKLTAGKKRHALVKAV